MSSPSTARVRVCDDLSVVIPTRDRGADVLAAVHSILAGGVLPAEVLIVDQSSDCRTQSAMRRFRDESRIRYVPSDTLGISAALNEGIARTRTPCSAIIGDDCEVERGWMEALLEEFRDDPRVAIVFGSVLPHPQPDPSTISASYLVERRVSTNRLSDKHRIGGTSACMAIRKPAWEQLGGFDEVLGIGAPLASAEETDLTIRALAAGYAVCETPAARVVHRSRLPSEARFELIRRNWFGTGAAFAKSLRARQLLIVPALLRLGMSWARGRSGVGQSMGPGDHRLAMLRAFVAGAQAGFRHPLEADRARFKKSTPCSEAAPGT